MNDIRRTILWVIFGFSMVMLWDQWQVYNGNKATFFPSPAKTAGSTAAPASAVTGLPTAITTTTAAAGTATMAQTVGTSAGAPAAAVAPRERPADSAARLNLRPRPDADASPPSRLTPSNRRRAPMRRPVPQEPPRGGGAGTTLRRGTAFRAPEHRRGARALRHRVTRRGAGGCASASTLARRCVAYASMPICGAAAIAFNKAVLPHAEQLGMTQVNLGNIAWLGGGLGRRGSAGA